MYLIWRRTMCPFWQWKTKGSRWHSLMERYLSGRTSMKLFLLVLELIHSTRLEEVHWGLWHVIQLFKQIYAPEVCTPSLQSPSRSKKGGDRDNWIKRWSWRYMSRLCRREANKGTIPLKCHKDNWYLVVDTFWLIWYAAHKNFGRIFLLHVFYRWLPPQDLDIFLE